MGNPATTWAYRAQQAIRKKGAYPKMSLTPANISTGARVSTGTHSHPASMLAWPLCSPGAHIPPGVRLAQCPISPGARVSTGTHTSTMLVFHSTPCSPDGRVSSNAHAHLVLMFHPILKGNRSDTYRARTSGTTPWQESYSMHDFEAPDVKWSLCRQDSCAMYSEFPNCI